MTTVAELIIDALADHGVRSVWGVVGDALNPITDAIRREDRIEWIGVRHEEAGAFAVVLEMVPADVAKRVTAELAIPTVGIGAGPDCDAQVLVWQDMAGLNRGRTPRFVKRYAALGDALFEAARTFGSEVRDGVYPDPEHSYS